MCTAGQRVSLTITGPRPSFSALCRLAQPSTGVDIRTSAHPHICTSLHSFTFIRLLTLDLPFPPVQVHLFWLCPDMECFEWFFELLEQIESSNQNRHIEIHIYLTRGWKRGEPAGSSSSLSLSFSLLSSLSSSLMSSSLSSSFSSVSLRSLSSWLNSSSLSSLLLSSFSSVLLTPLLPLLMLCSFRRHC